MEDELVEDELVEGTVTTATDVLTEVVLGGVVLDELDILKKRSDVVVSSVVDGVDIVVGVVVVLSSKVVVVSASSPHTPLQATICPLTHSVPAAVGPKKIKPPWSHSKKVTWSSPQKSCPSGAQSP